MFKDCLLALPQNQVLVHEGIPETPDDVHHVCLMNWKSSRIGERADQRGQSVRSPSALPLFQKAFTEPIELVPGCLRAHVPIEFRGLPLFGSVDSGSEKTTGHLGAAAKDTNGLLTTQCAVTRKATTNLMNLLPRLDTGPRRYAVVTRWPAQ